MTPRMVLYLALLGKGETITAGILAFVTGLIGIWVVWSLSPWKFFRRLAGTPFWTLALGIFVLVLIGLLFLKGVV